MTIGTRVRLLLEEKNTKQAALADALHISTSTLSSYMTGRTKIPGDIVAQIAQYFDVTTDYLLGLTPDCAASLPLTDSERNLLLDFRTLSKNQKELIGVNVRFMKEQNSR